MPLSLRIPSDKERLIRRAAAKLGKSKSAFILETVYEKLGLTKSRQECVREMAGWLSHKEAAALRKSMKVFDQADEEDWR